VPRRNGSRQEPVRAWSNRGLFQVLSQADNQLAAAPHQSVKAVTRQQTSLASSDNNNNNMIMRIMIMEILIIITTIITIIKSLSST